MRARAFALGLLGVALLGAGTRLLPLLWFPLWGSDTGEYHRIAAQLLAEGRISLDYAGWGVAYPWFPGLYAVAGGVGAMTGLGLGATLLVLVPALAGLAALAAALLAYEVFREPRASLLAGAALAVLMPHAFATSHPMPGALGHLFLLGALLLVARAEREAALWPALALLLAALAATHHLSTYMLLLALGGLAATRALLVARPEPARHRAACAALGLTLGLALAWWAWAEPVRERIVPAASPLGLGALGALAFAGLAFLWLLPSLRARAAWRYAPRHPSPTRGLKVAGVMLALLLGGSAAVGAVRVPGTGIQVSPEAVLWFLPLALLLAFGFWGSGLAKFRPRGAQAYGWALGQFAGFLAAAAAGSVVLLPYRHLEYLVEPAAVLAGGGLAALLAAARPRGARGPAALAVAALLLANAGTAYPSPAILAGFQEGTTEAELDAVAWARGHITLERDALVAADHRMSSILFGLAGLNATWEFAPLTFHAASFEEARAEMLAVPAPSGAKRVDYVFLSDPMREGLALEPWEPARPLSLEAQAKFETDPHYLPVCADQAVVIYRVDWNLEAARPLGVPPCKA